MILCRALLTFLEYRFIMYLDDHGTSHYNGTYGDYAGSFAELLSGQVPPQQAKKINDFTLSNQTELREKWNELNN
jgi:hypothetical protein